MFNLPHPHPVSHYVSERNEVVKYVYIREKLTEMINLPGESVLIEDRVILIISSLKLWCAQSCPTLCDPTNCSPPGFPVHRIFQAIILELVAISSSRGSSRPRDRTCIAGSGLPTTSATWEAMKYLDRNSWKGWVLCKQIRGWRWEPFPGLRMVLPPIILYSIPTKNVPGFCKNQARNSGSLD